MTHGRPGINHIDMHGPAPRTRTAISHRPIALYRNIFPRLDSHMDKTVSGRVQPCPTVHLGPPIEAKNEKRATNACSLRVASTLTRSFFNGRLIRQTA